MSLVKNGFFNDGMKSYKADPSASNFFLGTWDLDQTNLDRYDPFVGGYAYIVWTKLPAFFSNDLKTAFKRMTEKNFKSFDGVQDMTLESEAVGLGFAGNTMDVATNLKKFEGTFTLKHQEYMGSPIRELYEYWVTGIRDFETGLATYHGAITGSNPIEYSAKNHTGELLYFVTDPTGSLGGAKAIEFACYYTNVFPTKLPQAHLNYSSGEHNTVEIDQEFKGVFHRSKKIDELAKQVIASRTTIASFRDYGNDEISPGMTKMSAMDIDIMNNVGKA